MVKIKVNSDWVLGCSLRVFPRGELPGGKRGEAPCSMVVSEASSDCSVRRAGVFLFWLKRIKKIRAI